MYLLCEMCLYSMFAQVTCTQNRFCHVDYMEIVSFRLTAHFQLDRRFPYSWGGFPSAPLGRVAPSDCCSLDSPHHLGHTLTEAPLSIITNPSSRSAQPSWPKVTSMIAFSIVNTHYSPVSALSFWTFTILSWLARD